MGTTKWGNFVVVLKGFVIKIMELKCSGNCCSGIYLFWTSVSGSFYDLIMIFVDHSGEGLILCARNDCRNFLKRSVVFGQ